MKGLPLAYNKDMQEDKEAIFDAVDTVKMCLTAFTPMLDTMKDVYKRQCLPCCSVRCTWDICIKSERWTCFTLCRPNGIPCCSPG